MLRALRLGMYQQRSRGCSARLLQASVLLLSVVGCSCICLPGVCLGWRRARQCGNRIARDVGHQHCLLVVVHRLGAARMHRFAAKCFLLKGVAVCARAWLPPSAGLPALA